MCKKCCAYINWRGLKCVQNLIGKPTRKRPFGKPRRRWEDNNRMDLRLISISMRNWVDTAQGRDYWRTHVNAALNLRVT